MNFLAPKKSRGGFCSMNKMLVPLLFMVFLVGCKKKDDDPRIAELQNQMVSLDTLTSNQSNVIKFIWNQNLVAQTNLNNLRSTLYAYQFADNSVSISPDGNGSGLLKTPFGNLFISTESIEPYQGGYLVHLKIGNPTTAHFNGFSLICSTYQTTNAIGTFHSFTNDFPDELSAGYWTPVAFALVPASMDQLRNASVSVQLNQINLLEKNPLPSPDATN
ncbi:MAG: hypothetical protein ABR955_02215 [Verrucomicrobiota bacterium]|jgi:hypothetical protein